MEFNPLEKEINMIENENAKEGGLGILIVKEMVDSVSYSRVNNKNVLVMKKKLK